MAESTLWGKSTCTVLPTMTSFKRKQKCRFQVKLTMALYHLQRYSYHCFLFFKGYFKWLLFIKQGLLFSQAYGFNVFGHILTEGHTRAPQVTAST